jgi:3-methyladenine DNA glycosylase Mpg
MWRCLNCCGCDPAVAVFSEILLARMPPPHAAEAEYPPAFLRMAELLLHGTTLRVAGVPHRLTEIEFYVNGPGHRDPFIHGDPMQKKGGFWYFHRTGGRYRSGTYKGLDIAIGHEDRFGGILIRGVEQLEPLPRLLDGPCVCVDHLLALNGAPSIEQLVSRFDGKIDAPAGGESPLSLEVAAAPRKQPIFACPRVGLTLKRSASEEGQKFLARPYRFLSEPKAIKKGKPNLVTALHRAGRSVPEIVALSGAPKARVVRYVAAFESGKGRPAEQYREELSSEQLCELFGACDHLLA